MNKNILITGGAGFIGSHVVRLLSIIGILIGFIKYYEVGIMNQYKLTIIYNN